MNQKQQDAPGWCGKEEGGPVCWKCLGTGKKSCKKKVDVEQVITCPVCFGKGKLEKKKLKKKNLKPEVTKKKIKESIKGPKFQDQKVEINEEIEEISQLLGHWKIIQSLKDGHRWSSDDLLTAWVACMEIKQDEHFSRHLDLGCGIGTVLLMISWFFYDKSPKGVGIEAQSISFEKARRSIIMNGLNDRLNVINKDFRECVEEVRDIVNEHKFELVTGTPPYFPVFFDKETGKAFPGSGGLPTFEQSAPARYEFRGGIEAYISTASLFISENGILVLCEGNLATPPNELIRVQESAKNNHFVLIKTVLVHGRDDKPPLFAVHVLTPTNSKKIREFEQVHLSIRHVGGKRTKDYLELCEEMGIPPFSDE